MRKRSGQAEFARTICDSIRDGKPDMFNSVPKRAVSLEEAKKHGWVWFWTKEKACKQGHIAARYVSNDAMCVDCNRIAQDKPPIYPSNAAYDLTGDVPEFVPPVADDSFDWTPAKQKQFFTSWINTASVLQALKAIGAQRSHLIRILDENPTFKTEYERTRDTAVTQSQLWEAEDRAATGSDKFAAQMAASKFPDSFRPGSKTDLGSRLVRTPEQIRAAFTRLVQRVAGPTGAEERSRAESQNSPPAIQTPIGNADAGAGGVASSDGRDGLLLEDDPNSDLVSD